jgi:alkanesulfonate monooxygenase SsuD/methylene tetrahydromethanopterin reductase-like flavin-dependent oxidoreductase (luciferase family)
VSAHENKRHDQLRTSRQSRDQTLDQLVEYARRVEDRGFPGLWVTDSLGRGRPTVDPLSVLAALSVAAKRVELSTAVLQVPLRHPVELARCAQTVQALSGGRLRLSVGSGSTKADFDLFEVDFSERFRRLMGSLDILRQSWKGEPVKAGTLSPWPGC